MFNITTQRFSHPWLPAEGSIRATKLGVHGRTFADPCVKDQKLVFQRGDGWGCWKCWRENLSSHVFFIARYDLDHMVLWHLFWLARGLGHCSERTTKYAWSKIKLAWYCRSRMMAACYWYNNWSLIEALYVQQGGGAISYVIRELEKWATNLRWTEDIKRILQLI